MYLTRGKTTDENTDANFRTSLCSSSGNGMGEKVGDERRQIGDEEERRSREKGEDQVENYSGGAGPPGKWPPKEVAVVVVVASHISVETA